MHGKSTKGAKKLAAAPKYVRPAQLILPCFTTPFDQQLNPANPWVRLAHSIPRDARKAFLNTAKKKQTPAKVIYKANGQQLG